MYKIFNIIYVQKYLYIYNENYLIIDVFINNTLNINVGKIIKKNKKIFTKELYIKSNNNYYLNKGGIIVLSIILNSFFIVEKLGLILDSIEIIEKLNNKDKIKQIE